MGSGDGPTSVTNYPVSVDGDQSGAKAKNILPFYADPNSSEVYVPPQPGRSRRP